MVSGNGMPFHSDKKGRYDMKQSVNRRILDILIPAIAENALLMLSGMILTGYMGRLSVSDISSYGIAQRIYGICFSVVNCPAPKGTRLVTRSYGPGVTTV